jgi:hypothetical protein
MRTLKITAAFAALALALTPTAAMAARVHTFAHKSASGDFAIALAGGTVKHPGRITVKVTASPRQRVSVTWNMVCGKGTSAGSKSGDFKARAPVIRALRQPMRNPDNCTVSASAQLDKGGRVTVALRST